MCRSNRSTEALDAAGAATTALNREGFAARSGGSAGEPGRALVGRPVRQRVPQAWLHQELQVEHAPCDEQEDAERGHAIRERVLFTAAVMIHARELPEPTSTRSMGMGRQGRLLRRRQRFANQRCGSTAGLNGAAKVNPDVYHAPMPTWVALLGVGVIVAVAGVGWWAMYRARGQRARGEPGDRPLRGIMMSAGVVLGLVGVTILVGGWLAR